MVSTHRPLEGELVARKEQYERKHMLSPRLLTKRKLYFLQRKKEGNDIENQQRMLDFED